MLLEPPLAACPPQGAQRFQLGGLVAQAGEERGQNLAGQALIVSAHQRQYLGQGRFVLPLENGLEQAHRSRVEHRVIVGGDRLGQGLGVALQYPARPLHAVQRSRRFEQYVRIFLAHIYPQLIQRRQHLLAERIPRQS